MFGPMGQRRVTSPSAEWCCGLGTASQGSDGNEEGRGRGSDGSDGGWARLAGSATDVSVDEGRGRVECLSRLGGETTKGLEHVHLAEEEMNTNESLRAKQKESEGARTA